MRTSYSTVVQKVSKTPDEVAAQIERWFLLYHKTEKASFNGAETFTIFDLLCPEKQNLLIKEVALDKQEIPVLVLFLGKAGLPAQNDVMTFFFSGSRLYPALEGKNVFIALTIVSFVSVLSCFYPAWIAMRVTPRQAMSSEE